jgi:colicin import membrane protein
MALEPSSADEDFVLSLIGYLQGYLQLPDVGEVQIQLTLRKDGKVENMKVIKAESEKNRKYLEENLPKLSFPAIYLDKTASRSFLFTFCNKF